MSNFTINRIGCTIQGKDNNNGTFTVTYKDCGYLPKSGKLPVRQEVLSVDEVVKKFGKEILSQPTHDCFAPQINKEPKNLLEGVDTLMKISSPQYAWTTQHMQNLIKNPPKNPVEFSDACMQTISPEYAYYKYMYNQITN